MKKAHRKVVVFTSLIGVLVFTSALLMALAPAPLTPDATNSLFAVDQPQSMYLCELALDFAQRTLIPGGGFIVKAFHGEGFDAYMKAVRAAFTTVKSIKPKASRPRSKETYIVAQGLKHV